MTKEQADRLRFLINNHEACLADLIKDQNRSDNASLILYDYIQTIQKKEFGKD